MEYNQLKQYGTEIHEDTADSSTPVARMIPSVIDAKYTKLFLAAPDLYEACKELITAMQILIQNNTRVLSRQDIMSVARVADSGLKVIAKVEK